MGAYLNALREEGTREDLLRELEKQIASTDSLDKMLRQRMSRSAPIEEWLMQAGMGKRPLPTADECREWSIKLGIPDDMREFAPADKDAEIARLTAALRRYACNCHRGICETGSHEDVSCGFHAREALAALRSGAPAEGDCVLVRRSNVKADAARLAAAFIRKHNPLLRVLIANLNELATEIAAPTTKQEN